MGRGEKSWSILSQHAVFWKLNEAKVKQRLTLPICERFATSSYCLGLVSMKPPHCVNPTSQENQQWIENYNDLSKVQSVLLSVGSVI